MGMQDRDWWRDAQKERERKAGRARFSPLPKAWANASAAKTGLIPMLLFWCVVMGLLYGLMSHYLKPKPKPKPVKVTGHGGVSEALITRALHRLNWVSGDGSKNVYDRHRVVDELLRQGVTLRPAMVEHKLTVRLVNWKNPQAKHFAAADGVKGADLAHATKAGSKRPDLVISVNGIALGILKPTRCTAPTCQIGPAAMAEPVRDLFVRLGATAAQREAVLLGWYRERLKTLIAPRLEKCQPTLAVQASLWGVKKIPTNWSSCDPAPRTVDLLRLKTGSK